MGKNKIKVGEKAPQFKIESYNAGLVDLSELIGKQKIVLIFSRYFGCNICQLDFNILLEAVPKIKEKGAKLLYITQSGEKVANEFIEKYNVDFPIIPSSKDDLYEDYGLGLMTLGAITQLKSKMKEATNLGIEHGEYEGWEKQSAGQFVIDEQGNILHERKGWLLLPEIFAVL
ncbi:MAG: redoxin domain-containing protein [Candidatus Lokiarchaeota archaeon]|nr:redoxin domain-containing protein [Candidatus Lokiarchaeota archaeon]